MNIQHIDRTKFPPTLETGNGSAWDFDLDALRVADGGRKPNDSSVALWLVFAPWSHPVWPYVWISVCHLRPNPGMPPARFARVGASHEIVVAAHNPEIAPEPANVGKSCLRPMNYVGQWIEAVRPNPIDLDRAARDRVRGTVEEILARKLNPDSDGLRGWIERYGDHCLRR